MTCQHDISQQHTPPTNGVQYVHCGSCGQLLEVLPVPGGDS